MYLLSVRDSWRSRSASHRRRRRGAPSESASSSETRRRRGTLPRRFHESVPSNPLESSDSTPTVLAYRYTDTGANRSTPLRPVSCVFTRTQIPYLTIFDDIFTDDRTSRFSEGRPVWPASVRPTSWRNGFRPAPRSRHDMASRPPSNESARRRSRPRCGTVTGGVAVRSSTTWRRGCTT